MKNDALKKFLEQALQENEDLTDDTVVMLQDASLHVALKRGMSMQAAAATYTVLAVGHEFMREVFGLDTTAGTIASDPALKDLFGTTARNPEQEKREKELLDAILKDLPLDL